MTSGSNQRNICMDVVKGVAIICVIWVHCVQYLYIDDSVSVYNEHAVMFIDSFIMPLFMLVSGYFFARTMRSKSFITILKSRFTSLIWPAFVWGTILYVTQFLVCNLITHEPMSFDIAQLWGAVHGAWFLWSLLVCSLVVTVVGKLLHGAWETIILIVVFPLLYFLPNYTSHMFMYPYFIAGYLYQTNKELLSDKFIYTLKGLMVIAYPILFHYFTQDTLIYITGIIDLSAPSTIGYHLLIDLQRYITGFCGCVFVIMLTNYFVQYFKASQAMNLLSQIGKNSLQIYVMQKVAVEYLLVGMWSQIVQRIGFNPLTPNVLLYDWVFTLLIAVISTLLLHLIVKQLSRIHTLSLALFGR